ncbi:hypothetical protein HHI36_017370 [Cryptolaemus montrouzieri]|uniref:Peptidase A2 domain-containing protein n=1 Tax=Cryptolaemus montrouzieri TaxID=559131 RepID=A0ABD2NMM0_9CUCU
MCHMFESSRSQTAEMSKNKENDLSIYVLSRKPKLSNFSHKIRDQNNKKFNNSNKTEFQYDCLKPNHYEIDCFKNKNEKKFNNIKRKFLHSLEEGELSTDDDADVFFINSLAFETVNSDEEIYSLNNELSEDVIIYNVSVCFKVDTGAQCNVLPTKLFKDLTSQRGRMTADLKDANVNLIAYGGSRIGVKS